MSPGLGRTIEVALIAPACSGYIDRHNEFRIQVLCGVIQQLDDVFSSVGKGIGIFLGDLVVICCSQEPGGKGCIQVGVYCLVILWSTVTVFVMEKVRIGVASMRISDAYC